MPRSKSPNENWHVSPDEELWAEAADDREGAIEYGREEYDGEGFYIGVGVKWPLSKVLFFSPDYLGDLIDNANEDAGWDDALSNEIADSELKALTDDMNRIWLTWAEQIGLQDRVRGLRISKQEWIEPEPLQQAVPDQ